MAQSLAFSLAFMMSLAVFGAEDNPNARMSIGDVVGPFKVKDITGPSAGEMVCYRCKFGTNPVACIFTREMTPEVASPSMNSSRRTKRKTSRPLWCC